MRSQFRVKDPEEIRRLRAQLYEQDDVPGVAQATAFRIEHRRMCNRDSAKAYYLALQTKIPFESLFELATKEDYYGWGRVEDAASRVGEYLFGEFKATAVISYSGPSAIFASLAMAKGMGPGVALLSTPVYLAMNMTLKMFSKTRAPRGFTVLKEKKGLEKDYQCVVSVPNTLRTDDPNNRYRIAFIDDLLMTGRPLRLLKDYLIETCGYEADQIRVGCCVCHAMTLARRDETTPNKWGFVTKIDPSKENVRFPWGEGVFFPPPESASTKL